MNLYLYHVVKQREENIMIASVSLVLTGNLICNFTQTGEISNFPLTWQISDFRLINMYEQTSNSPKEFEKLLNQISLSVMVLQTNTMTCWGISDLSPFSTRRLFSREATFPFVL